MQVMPEPAAIETARLLVTPFSEGLLTARYVAWLNDPQVVRYSQQRLRRHTLESCRDYWQSFAGTPNYFWAILAPDSPFGHIGNITASVNPTHGVADVGILIGERSVWGRGYGLEAWTAVCNHLLRVIGMRKVTGGTLAVNHAMLRIMQRAGMAEDGRRIRHCIFEGRPVDVIHMALFNRAD